MMHKISCMPTQAEKIARIRSKWFFFAVGRLLDEQESYD